MMKKFTRKQKFLYFALAPFLLMILLTIIPVPKLQFVAISMWYLVLFSWFCYAYFLWIRWIARTAERAGRSFAGFMVFGILMPVIASIVVLTFKQDKIVTLEKARETKE